MLGAFLFEKYANSEEKKTMMLMKGIIEALGENDGAFEFESDTLIENVCHISTKGKNKGWIGYVRKMIDQYIMAQIYVPLIAKHNLDC